MDSAKSEEFNSKAKQSKPTDTDATSITEWLKASGRGTVLKEVTHEYPRRVRKLKDFQVSDWKMRQNAKTMREILRCLEDGMELKIAMEGATKLKNIQGTPHERIEIEYTVN